MSEEELKILRETFRKNTDLWERAFKEYNEAHPRRNPLNMKCLPCWGRVFQWHKNKLAE